MSKVRFDPLPGALLGSADDERPRPRARRLRDAPIESGPAATTLDAVAAAAHVSKGGLLYHFASKDALATGLLGRLRARSAADADAIRAAADGATAYYLTPPRPAVPSRAG